MFSLFIQFAWKAYNVVCRRWREEKNKLKRKSKELLNNQRWHSSDATHGVWNRSRSIMWQSTFAVPTAIFMKNWGKYWGNGFYLFFGAVAAPLMLLSQLETARAADDNILNSAENILVLGFGYANSLISYYMLKALIQFSSVKRLTLFPNVLCHLRTILNTVLCSRIAGSRQHTWIKSIPRHFRNRIWKHFAKHYDLQLLRVMNRFWFDEMRDLRRNKRRYFGTCNTLNYSM